MAGGRDVRLAGYLTKPDIADAENIVANANNQPVTVNGATTVIINAATKVRMVTPLFECTGDIVDNCDTNAQSMASMRQDHDEHGHPVVDVQTGGSTITTGTPTVPE